MTDLPLILAALSDAHVAFGRISRLLLAEERAAYVDIRPDSHFAIEVSGDFVFETSTVGMADTGTMKDKMEDPPENKQDFDSTMSPQKKASQVTNLTEAKAKGKKRIPVVPFALKDVQLSIPKGGLVCIYGRVGSGKSALLQGLLGEIQRTRGHVVFGGSVGFVSQNPVIQSTSLEENIIFGKEPDPKRLQDVLNACALIQDLSQLPDGINTEIGDESSRH